MLTYVLAVCMFVLYSYLIHWSTGNGFKLTIQQFGYSFFFWLLSWGFLFLLLLFSNFIFFGDPLSPLEQELLWVPVIRGPLFEEGCKLLSIYVLNKTQKPTNADLLSYGGFIGNWFFLIENVGYIDQRNLGLDMALIRMLPWHILYTMFDALGFQKNFRKFRFIFPVLSIIIHGVTNYLSTCLQLSDYVLYGISVSFPLLTFLLIISQKQRVHHDKTQLSSK